MHSLLVSVVADNEADPIIVALTKKSPVAITTGHCLTGIPDWRSSVGPIFHP